MKNLKLVVKEKMQKKGLSMNLFSELVGISPTAMQKILRENSTSISTLEKMAEILGISTRDFFEESSYLAEPEIGYTKIKNEELIELQNLALGNIKKQLQQSKNIEIVTK